MINHGTGVSATQEATSKELQTIGGWNKLLHLQRSMVLKKKKKKVPQSPLEMEKFCFPRLNGIPNISATQMWTKKEKKHSSK